MKQPDPKMLELYNYLLDHPCATYEQMSKAVNVVKINSLVKKMQRKGNITIERLQDTNGRYKGSIKKCVKPPVQ